MRSANLLVGRAGTKGSRSRTHGYDVSPLGKRPAMDLSGAEHCACLNFRKTARALTQLYDAGLQSSGIRATQFTLLVGIAKCEPVPIGCLAEVLILDRTTLSRSALRQRFVTLLPGGRARSLPLWRETQRILVGQIGDKYWNSVEKQLKSLAATALALEASRRRVSLDASRAKMTSRGQSGRSRSSLVVISFLL